MRTLAAVMFTDIVGYSAIMSKDESLAMAVLEKNREINKAALSEYNGEFIKEIGDGTLCIFRSSYDALNCAIWIQQAMAKESAFRLRIGIHIGDLVMTDNDVFGDCVNIASRIESICEPGGICFTQRVYEDIQNKIELKVHFIGEKTLKNILNPVSVYSIPASELHPGIAQPELKIISDKKIRIPALKKTRPLFKSRAFIIISATLVIMLAAFFIFRPLVLNALVPTEPIPIAVISFENQTGDSKFDYLQKAIPNLLITNLEQSHLFRVITWERMQDLLVQMGKSDVKTIDPAIGFEVCKQEGVNLIVIGSYVKAGELFVTDVKILDVNTKQLIKSVSARGTGEVSILQSQIDELSKEISNSAGIPYQRIQTAGLHVLDVTTNSMEAYDYFLKGRDAIDKMYYNDARIYFEEALRRDSTFAVAWLYLSNAYGSLEDKQMRNRAIEKAYKFSSRATENEQLNIKATFAKFIDNNPVEELRLLNEIAAKMPKEKRVYYALGVWYCNHGRPDEAIIELNKAIDLDPRYSEPLNQIAYQYMKKGMYAEALSYFRRYVALSPKEANPHDSMGDLLWQMGKLDEAIAEYSKALDIKPDFHVSAGKAAYINAMKEDYAQAGKWLNRAIDIAPSPGTRANWHWVSAWLSIWCGNLVQANASLNMAYQLAYPQDNFNTISGIYWLKAFMERDLGRYDSAEANFNKALRIFLEDKTDSEGDSASYFLFTATVNLAQGKIDSARIGLDNVKRLVPQITSTSKDVFRYWYDCTNQDMLIAQHEYQAAVEQGKSIRLPELPEFEFPQVLIYNIPSNHDFLARAYEGLGNIGEAIKEYERLITFDPAGTDRRLIHPVYHARLARLYEQAGQPEKALSQQRLYDKLWNNNN